MSVAPNQPLIAIACGGTGGHLFPGLAVAERLRERGGRVLLLVSRKEIDRQAVESASDVDVLTLPAVGLSGRRVWAFFRGLAQSYRVARNRFKSDPPGAALAMGGFTSVGPMLAARRGGSLCFLHESNAVPGRANRLVSRGVNHAFVGFSCASSGLRCSGVTVTGTPVRHQFRRVDAQRARLALGLAPDRPVLIIMGGSQGAAGVNELVLRSLMLIAEQAPELQYLHLSGATEAPAVRSTYDRLKLDAVVLPFLAEMERGMDAATVAVSRAGASSLAELAAMELPAVLIPYPHAVDGHQLLNARAFEATGAAGLLEQSLATPESLARSVLGLVQSEARRAQMRQALSGWQAPQAADQIAQHILRALTAQRSEIGRKLQQATV